MLSRILEAIYEAVFHTNSLDATKLDVYHPR